MARDAAGKGVAHVRKDDRDRPHLPLESSGSCLMPGCRPTSSCERWSPIVVTAGPTKVHPQHCGHGPTESASACVNAETRRCPSGSFSSYTWSTPVRRTRSPCCARGHEHHAATPPSLAMKLRLRTGFAPYWITSSASASSLGEISTPMAFAVFRLTTSRNLVAYWTGKSLTLAPRRMRST